MTTRTASCSCGQLSLTVTGEPIRVSVCHCLACQKRTGSTYGAQARFAANDVTVHGQSTEYLRVGDSGGRITFHFCPRCGSTVYYQLDQVPDAVAIPVGVFADPSFPAPRVSVYEVRRHSWVSVPEGADHYD